MLTVSLVVIICVALSSCLIALAIYLTDTKDSLKRTFLAFVLAIAAWIVSNHISSNPSEAHNILLWSNRIVLVAGGAAVVLAVSFVVQLSGMFEKYKLPLRGVYAINIMAWILSLTNLVVNDIRISDGQVLNDFGSLAMVYFVALIGTTALLCVLMVLIYFKSTGLLKHQIRNITYSALFVAPVVMIGNAIMPLLFDNYDFASYTPLSVLAVVAAIASAVVRHRLFDIRLAAMRTVGYLLTISVLILAYMGIAYALSLIFFSGHTSDGVGLSPINIVIAIFLALVFQPIKKFFDSFTNHIFYRHDYDPQAMLDQIGSIVARQTHTKPLLKETLDVIKKSIKPASAKFVVVDENGDKEYMQGFGDMKITHDTVLGLIGAQQALFIVDNLDSEFYVLQKQLQDADVEVVAQLDTANGTSGYLILGGRLSGLSYGKRDMDFISVMTDELAVAIENSERYEEIQELNRTLQAKVKEATSELQSTNNKLQALDKTKDDFIAMASHQLRTPLTTIKGYVSMLLDGDAGDLQPSQRRLLEETFNSSQRMVYIIGDLLNVSRIQTGKFQLEYSDVDLASVLEEEIQLVKISAIPRRITLDYDRPENVPIVQLDEGKIRQVMMNFIDNAIYYSPMSSKIKIVLQAIGSNIEFKVVDEGIGVPKNEQHKLFVKFARATNARKQRPDGTGIGLFMAKKVVVALGGSIIFESVEGKGSTFGFRIPIK